MSSLFLTVLSLSCAFGQDNSILRVPVAELLDRATVWTAEPNHYQTSAEGRIHRIELRDEARLRFSSEDDKKILALRLEGPHAAALRVHFEDFRIPNDASVLVHGFDGNGVVTKTVGPYFGSGPLHSGEFWSRAVPGSRVVVEVRLPNEVASLPFHIREIAQLDGIEEGSDVWDSEGPTETAVSMFRGMPVEHRVVNGYGIWEGDIILGRVEELEPYSKEKRSRDSLSINGSSYRWPGGTIPYTIDTTLPSQTRITDAVNHWNTNLAGYIRLVPRTSETAYITFVRASSAGTCSSYVGRTGYAQPVNVGDYCSTGNVIHEVGHAIGLYHEHTRTDRNAYITVNTANIDPNASYNFAVVTNGTNVGPYDYSSIMHYGAYAFSINSLPTITTIPAGISIGQRSTLSSGDINGVKAIYSPTTTTSTSVIVTFASNPTGRTLVVDGQTVVAPASFTWQVGSTHTVSAPNAAFTGTQYAFTKWSDNGGQTHTVSVPSSATTLTASYKIRYLMTAVPSDPVKGGVGKTPLSADGYYDLNSAVTLSAAASAGNCFVSWSGILPVPDTTTQLTINQPYSVMANFQAGSITVPQTVSVAQAGGQYGISVSASSGCLWKATTSTNWISLGTTQGSTSGVLQISVGKNNSKSTRTGYVMVNGVTVSVVQLGR